MSGADTCPMPVSPGRFRREINLLQAERDQLQKAKNTLEIKLDGLSDPRATIEHLEKELSLSEERVSQLEYEISEARYELDIRNDPDVQEALESHEILKEMLKILEIPAWYTPVEWAYRLKRQNGSES